MNTVSELRIRAGPLERLVYDQQLNSTVSVKLMDYKVLGEHVRDTYRESAAQYRQDDEIEIATDVHRRLTGILANLTSSYNHPITVLDVGCGTGRYFHCLKNVRRLKGIDVCDEMLRIAQNPVRQEEITVNEIQLSCENVFLAKFPPGSFDFIYSLGMFGHGCPTTSELCNRFHDWLAPGGQLFFNVVSLHSMSFVQRVRRSVRTKLYPLLPRQIKKALDARQAPVPFFGLSRKDLAGIMRASRFGDYSISSHVYHSQLWRNVHLECQAIKSR